MRLPQARPGESEGGPLPRGAYCSGPKAVWTAELKGGLQMVVSKSHAGRSRRTISKSIDLDPKFGPVYSLRGYLRGVFLYFFQG